ncbi:outer membrane protein assembly factor BamB family protein [Mangrovivirga cuniculi]|uniref:Pyrrolo-quinoline quinone repeat domain-containing protein n=1 Tax=Mangrovivirga cuniculi TaxID=2715131 RepID=A0A4D7K3L8_9BACT|nr:PQQ-binding-like beta-propeller repeat protein [Mangrovivirga cuniculi]QCK15434.1 hypothetical protein DCC35_12105 [Mangrovivirga cuniculi]
MNRILFFVFALLFIATGTIQAQEKLWSKDLKEVLYEVGWVEQANNGYIIASGAKGLLALDHSTGKIVWHNKELKAVDRNSFRNIDGLPLFMAEYAPIAGKKRGIIINAIDGSIVFDTKDGNYSIKEYYLVPEKACILFELMGEGNRQVMKFSLKTWKEEWVADLGELKGLKAKVNNVMGMGFIKHGPIFTENELIIGLKEEIFAFNLKDGSTKWQMEADKNIKALVYSDLNNSLYLGVKGSKKLQVFEPGTGKDITPGKLKLRGTLIDIIDDGKGNLVLVESEGFNLIDPNSGEFKWKKSFKIDYLDEVIPYEGGYIAIGKDEKKSPIAIVDANGDKVWDTDVKGYIYYALPTKKGVLYLSTERSNILGYDKGKDVWDKDIKFKSIPAVTFDSKLNKIVFYEGGDAFKLDPETGALDQIAEDVEFAEVNKKTELKAEYVNDGYFFYTANHLSFMNTDGQVVYTKFFKAPYTIEGLYQIAEIGLAAYGIDVDIQGSIDNLKTLEAISNGTLYTNLDQAEGSSSSSLVVGLYSGTSSGTWEPVFEVTKKRYMNSKLTKDHQFVVTQMQSEGADPVFIYRINKATGEIDQKIPLMDKSPNYVIDNVDDRVFVNEKNKIITGYQL